MDDEVTTEETTAEDSSVSIDYDSLSESIDTPEPSEGTTDTTKNPAWDPILNLIPEQLHSQVIPHLSKTDKHVQQLQQTYAPYKSFIDQGITPEAINQGLTLGQAIAQNPQAVYDQMRNQFGLSHAEAIQALEDNEDEDGQGLEGGYDDDDDDEDGIDIDDVIANHPAFRQLQEQAERNNQREQEQAREVQLNSIREEVDREWSEIETMVGGKLSDDIKEDIMQRALHLAGDGLPVLKDGFNAHIKFVTKIRNTTANNSAPSVAEGNGLLPGAHKYDMTSADGRQQRMVDLMRASGMTKG